MHNWTEEDDVIALYLYLYGEENIPWKEYIKRKGISEPSMDCAIKNFQAIDAQAIGIEGKEGLSNFVTHQKRNYEKYKDWSKENLRNLVLQIIERDKI